MSARIPLHIKYDGIPLLKRYWENYKTQSNVKEKLQSLHTFLKFFVESFFNPESDIEFRYGSLTTVFEELTRIFIEDLYDIQSSFQSSLSPSNKLEISIYEYLCGIDKEGTGVLLLLALEILSKLNRKSRGIKYGITTTVLLSLLQILQIPPSSIRHIDIPEKYYELLTYGITFSSIFHLFDFPLVPSVSIFEQLFSNLQQTTNSLSTFTTRVRNEEQISEINANILESLSYRLLNILGNLMCKESLEELIKYDKLRSLLDILATYANIGQSTSDFGSVLLVQKQIVRTLCKLAASACMDIHQISLLKKQNFLASILGVLRRENKLPTVICLELCQLIKSSRITLLLFDDFQLYEGYSVLTNQMISIAKSGTKIERLHFIATIFHLLFIGNRSFGDFKHSEIPVVQNLESFKILLHSFENTESICDMKTELIHSIRAIFTLDSIRTGSSYLETLESFKILFLQFDSLSMSNKKLILTMMDEVLTKRELLPEELRSYCYLLEGKRPSTILLVCKHMIKLLEEEYITRDIMKSAGLIQILTHYLISPLEYNCVQLLKTDPEELKLALSLLSQNGTSEVNELTTLDTSIIDMDTGKVLYGMALTILELTRVVLRNSTENQTVFRESNGIKKLLTLLSDEILRTPALQVIAIIATSDVKNDWKIIPSMITTLQSSGGTASLDTNFLSMRNDILATLCHVFALNPSAKNAFRTGGGFIWTVSVLDGVGKCMDTYRREAQTKGETVEFSGFSIENGKEIFTFLKTLLHTLSVVLSNNFPNQSYFRDDIHFSTLSETLQACHFIEGQRAVELCDLLLNMAVKGTWPPSCSKHAPVIRLPPPWERQNQSTSLFVQSNESYSLSQSKSLTMTCQGCRDSLLVENPEIFKLIVQLLGIASRRKSSESQASFYVHVIKSLTFLSDVLPANQDRLSSIGLVGEILEYFKKAFLESNNLQSSLLLLIQKIASYNINLQEMRKYLELMKFSEFPLPILDTFVSISKRKHVPSYAANFAVMGLGYIEVHNMGDVTFPPSKGFAVSTWIHITNFANSHELELCILSFDSPNKNSTLEISMNTSGVLNLQLGSQSCSFSDYRFKPNRWYHVIVAYHAAKKGKGMMYVNGKLVHESTFHASVKSYLSKPSVRIGQSCKWSPKHPNAFPLNNSDGETALQASWQIGNICFFEEPITEVEALILYILGPNTTAGLDISEPTTCQIYDVINEKNVRDKTEILDLAMNATSSEYSALQDKLLFVMSVRNMVMAQSVRIPSMGGPNAPQITKALAPIYAKAISYSTLMNIHLGLRESADTSKVSAITQNLCTRSSVKEMIYNAGGMAIILYLLALLQVQKEYQRSGIELLRYLLQYNTNNVTEMLEICGYDILQLLMRKKTWILDEQMLSYIFQLVGITKNNRSHTFSVGVIGNLHAFKHLLLDWKIWKRASLSVQKTLFESLAELVSSHSLSQFNIRRFREAKILDAFFQMFSEHSASIPSELGVYFITIIKSVMSDPPSASELKMMVNYLVSTNETSHVINYNYIDSSASPANIRNIKRVTSLEQVKIYKKEMPTIRTFVVSMLLDILISSEKTKMIVEQFIEVCNLEILFGLLRYDSLTVRIILLKLLDVLLQYPQISNKFQGMNGWNLLGSHLVVLDKEGHASNTVSEEMFAILFCMLLGKPAHKYNSDNLSKSQNNHNSPSLNIRSYFLGQMTNEVSLKHPAVVGPILMLVEAGDISPDLQHSVIKTLHDLFLQNDHVKEDFLEHNIIKLLCDLFVAELERKKSDNEPPLSRSGSLSRVGSDAAERMWKTEENILAFLKAIALHGCMTSGISLLDEILTALEMLTVPGEYIYTLQRKILYDVLLFFHENYFLNNETLVATFKQLCTLACNHLCYSENLEFFIDPIQKRYIFDEIKIKNESNIWTTAHCLPNSLEFIKVLYQVLSQSKSKMQNAPHNYLPFFASLYAIQNQCARMTIFLIKSRVHKKHREWILSKLGETENGTPMIADFTSHEEFIIRLLFYTHKFIIAGNQSDITLYKAASLDNFNHLSSSTDGVQKSHSYADMPNFSSVPSFSITQDLAFSLEEQEYAINLWQCIFKSKKSYLKQLFVNFVNEINNVGDVQGLSFHHSVFQDVKKLDDKEGLLLKEWVVERFNVKEKKQAVYSRISESIRSNSHLVTTSLISIQQQQTKLYMEEMQEILERDKTIRNQWTLLIKKVTHERGVWTHLDHESSRWKLDNTEGTDRMRPRLKRFATHLPFLSASSSNLNSHSSSSSQRSKDNNNFISPEILAQQQKERLELLFLENSGNDTNLDNDFQNHLKPGEKILSYSKCSRITPFSKTDGEILIGENHCYFIDDYQKVAKQKQVYTLAKNIRWAYEDVKEIHKRRYLLKSNSMEIFLVNGKTYLLAFENEKDRDLAYDSIMSLELPNRVDYEYEVSGGMLKMSVTKKWKKGLISNFEYLMHLNTLAGRSFNDLTQYPIFPFILADYSSEELDLSNPSTFRDLSKPMGAQNPQRLAKFEERYDQLVEMGEQPFHYGSHYSNLGSVLHFLVRLEPFSQYFIEFQGGRFDVPDRAFHSLKQSWLLSSSLSSSDVKELIPEFFFLPEFLQNLNRFDMGVKQNSERVDDVVLPPWAHGSARLFIKRHREALESKYVSENLHHWIDLMFGYKQQGEEAIAARNVFHHLTYEGAVDIDSIDDKVQKEATIAQISSYGQTPKQLFKKPHPERDAVLPQPETFFTNPEKVAPYPMWSTSTAIGHLSLLGDTPIALGVHKILIFPKGDQFLSWGHWDQSLRVCSLDTGKLLSLIEMKHDDDTICAETHKGGNIIVTGGTACIVKVWKRSRNQKIRSEQLQLQSMLYGHSSPIMSLCVSQAWSLILSGSRDRTCIIWDLNRLSYVRTLGPHDGPVTAICISPNNGNIVTVDETKKGSTIRMWNINGTLLAKNSSPEKILCVKFTCGMEGVMKNVVISGQKSGIIKIWDSWDLSLLHQLPEMHKSPVTTLAISSDQTQLFSGDESGWLVCWSTKKPRDSYLPIGI